jgi:hypothetical protein
MSAVGDVFPVTPDAAFLQNASIAAHRSQGCTLGWDAMPRWGNSWRRGWVIHDASVR